MTPRSTRRSSYHWISGESLWGRDGEVAELDAHARAAGTGRGRAVTLVGHHGVGKTSLLRVGEAVSAAAGLRVLRARCAAAGQDDVHGVVRQLIGTVGDPEDAVARIAAMADEGALALCVDDLHWTDAASARILDRVRVHLVDLPVLLLATSRPGADDGWGADVAVHQIPVRPLETDAVAHLLREVLGPVPAEVAEAGRAVTGGNPFLIRELARDLRSVDGSALDAAAVQGRVPEALVWSTRSRLEAIGGGAAAVARAVAILGRGVELQSVGRLAGLPMPDTAAVVDALAADGVLAPDRPLRFACPLLRDAVLASIPTGERSALHAAAAAVVVDEADGLESACEHLLAADPGLVPDFAVATLRQGAARAQGKAAPEVAVTYLRRARAEVAPDDAGPVAEELAAVAVSALEPDALDLAVAAGYPAGTLLALGGPGPGVAATGALAAAWASWSNEPIGARPPAGDDLRWDAVAAVESAVATGDASTAVESARGAWADGDLLGRCGTELPFVPFALAAAALAGDGATLERWVAAGLHDAEAKGSRLGRCAVLGWRAWAREARGDLDGAAADARLAVELGARVVPALLAVPVALLAEIALLESGPVAATAELARLPFDGRRPQLLFAPRWWQASAAIALADGRPADALADLGNVEVWERRRPAPAGGLAQWRPLAVEALLALGAIGAAGEAAADGVERARRFGADRPLARALRAQALTAGPDGGIAMLDEAVALTDRGGCGLDGAVVRIDRARARRATGDADGAMRDAEAALAAADEAGAAALADVAVGVLLEGGVRPLRRAATGVRALTASERRVVDLAALMVPNREIARRLYLTSKTVESHLTRAYRKLGIRSREQLGEVLGDHGPAD